MIAVFKPLYLLAFCVCLDGFSTSPANLGTITSATPFRLDGHLINTPGVTTFPLVSGDVITTSAGSALLILQSGGTLKLAANSSLKITAGALAPLVTLLSGTVDRSSNAKLVAPYVRGSNTLASSISPPPVSRHY